MKTHQFEVDGYTYDFDAFGALEGATILGRVNAILGTGLRHATGGGAEEVTIAAIVGGLMSNLDDDRVVEVFKQFARRCRVSFTEKGKKQITMLGGPDGECGPFDQHFARRSKDMFVWFGKCFAWQYEDFLGSIKTTALSKFADLMLSLSTFLDSSTGSSGESSARLDSPTESSSSNETGN